MNKHVMLATCLLIGILIFGSEAVAGVGLFTDEEAATLRYDNASWEEMQPRGMVVTRSIKSSGPEIVFEQPIPDDAGSNIITVQSPTDLEIIFKEKSAPVHMESLEITAEKGFFVKSLTNSIKPFIKGNRIVAKKLEFPKGKYLIVINVSDKQGNKTLANYRLQVL